MSFTTPQLQKIHSGKVRESFRFSPSQRLIVVSDRISCFDQVLKSPIPGKGAALNTIANFWLKETAHIIPNHLEKEIAANAILAKEAEPIKLEVIVRKYLTGSMWRDYSKGKRVFSGLKVPDGLKKNSAFPTPLITPTTKEDKDREISPAEIFSTGLAAEAQYTKMEKAALELFDFGSRLLAQKGIILVDTKYEFGMWEGKLILIDEIHTPDSSRFWNTDDYQKNQDNPRSLDKESVRQWLLAKQTESGFPLTLPEEIIAQTRDQYQSICKTITGKAPFETDLYRILCAEKMIKPGYIAICMGSKGDLPFAEEIAGLLRKRNIFVEKRIVSAHKNGERIIEIAEEYNNSLEPGVVIAVAGLSNGLGGALAANLNIPVINCPPFKDNTDLQLNLMSSLMLPSGAPAFTVLGARQAADAAIRALNLPEIRQELKKEILAIKENLLEADLDVRRLEK